MAMSPEQIFAAAKRKASEPKQKSAKKQQEQRAVYVVLHYWPNQDGYTVMPMAYRKERDAMSSAMNLCQQDKGVLFESETKFRGSKHGYAIKPLDLE